MHEIQLDRMNPILYYIPDSLKQCNTNSVSSLAIVLPASIGHSVAYF